MSKEKYGFVYVWYNRVKKKFYIGCHWGTEDDGYICSSTTMRKAYRRNPRYFKRRIISRVYTNRQDLLEEEHKWLALIPDEELGKKYYNLNKHHFGHWTASPDARSVRDKISDSLKGKKRKPLSKEHRAKLSAIHSGKVLSEEHKANLKKTGTWNNITPGAWNKGIKHSEDTKQKIKNSVSDAYSDGSIGKKISEKLTGRTLSDEHVEKLRQCRIGRKWYTNGTLNKLIKEGDPIPFGYEVGMTKRLENIYG